MAKPVIDDGRTTPGEPAADHRKRRWIELGWQPIGDTSVPNDDQAAPRRWRLPELYVTDHTAARILSTFLAIGVAIGTAFWWPAAVDNFDVPPLVCADCVPPDWFRWSQLIIAIVGIVAAVVQVVYFLNFALRGVVWRRWRAVAIVFGALAAAYTLMWWIDRIWSDRGGPRSPSAEPLDPRPPARPWRPPPGRAVPEPARARG